MENINYLDAVLGGIVILSALIGLARGLVKEVLSLIAWIAAVYVAWLFAERVANDYIRQFIDDALISYLAAFGLLFLATLFVIGLFNLIITQLLAATGLGGFDRFLGMLFGLARGFIIGALAVFVLGLTPLTKESWWHESRLAPGFASVGAWGWEKLPANIRSILRDGSEKAAEAGAQLGVPVNSTEYTGQSGTAERPAQRAAGEQRNAISEMSEAEIRLELLSREQQRSQSQGTTQNANTPNDTQQGNVASEEPALPLQLESTQ